MIYKQTKYRMGFCKIILGFALIFISSFAIHAQTTTTQEKIDPWSIDTLVQPVPLKRQLWWDKINNQIKRADQFDGEVDSNINYLDAKRSLALTNAFIKKAPLIATHIENLDIDNNRKIVYLQGLEKVLIRLNATNWTTVSPNYFSKLLSNFEGLLKAELEDDVAHYVKQNLNIYMYDNSFLLGNYPETLVPLYEYMTKQYPDTMIKKLPQIADKPYADPVIALAAKRKPALILNYAMATNNMRAAVRRNNDPLVQTIVAIADESESPLKTLLFLSEIHSKNMSIAQVDKITANELQYFKALVKLSIENKSKDNYLLDDEIKHLSFKIIRTINDLHNENDAVRFRAIDPYNAQELYYITVGGQDDIYTSSFTNGTFRQLMQKMKPTPGNKFIDSLPQKHFRTFIRMCSGFNTIQTFLSTFEPGTADELLKNFVANLEAGDDDDLEAAVDVADAYSSITDEKIQQFLKAEVKENLQRVTASNSKKGMLVYKLLDKIFNENTDSNAQDDLALTPISYVPFSELQDGENGVVEQVFFYGDDIGMGAYNNFIGQFRNGKWKITSNRYWTTITSTGPNKATVYVNIPLPEATGQDEEAQMMLAAYLDSNNIHPTILVHRGHSYYLPTTLEYLQPSMKVIMLGSCGGYNSLATVLNGAPDAHIISSKQIGAMRVNVPIINELNNYVYAGKDMHWADMWKDLTKRFSGSGAYANDLFSDYVPPNKNLGSIFIKAYRQLSEQNN